MLASAGVAGTIGRALLLVGFVGAVFGAFAAITGVRNNEPRVIRLVSRFAVLAFAAAVGAFAVMEYAMITRDFRLHMCRKLARGRHLRFTTLRPCGAHLKVRS